MTNPELLERVEYLNQAIWQAQTLLWKANVKPDTLEGKAKAVLEKAMKGPDEGDLRAARENLQRRLIAGNWPGGLL